jgi:riboflavin synthase
MFTGIITDIGRVAAVERRGDTRFVVETSWDTAGIPIGASIACSGVCLTAVETSPGRFAADASAETLSKTTLGAWAPGTPVNLERSLRVGDELGGHFVYGHVDGVAAVVSVEPEGDSHRIVIEAPAALARYVAPKGSVAVDGVSLTVNAVDGARFGVNIIPHTWAATTLRHLRPGSRANLEIDMLARYLQRLHEAG